MIRAPFEKTIGVREAEQRFEQVIAEVAAGRGVYLVVQDDIVCFAIIPFATYARWISGFWLDHQDGTPLVAFVSIEAYNTYKRHRKLWRDASPLHAH